MKSRLSSLVSLLLAACAFCILLTDAHAEAVDNDLQTWEIVTLRVEMPHKLLLYGEVQPRVGLEGSPDNNGLDRIILRPAVGYQLTPNVSLWQGYAWTPSFNPDYNSEHRLFQQLLVENKVKKLSLTNRSRLEERFIDGAGGTSVRARHMARVAYPLGKSGKWSAVGYDEFFVNLNDTRSGPQSGFDQNRVFVGLNRTLNERLNVEAGYLVNYLNRDNAEDKLQHVILAWVNVKL